MQEMSIDNQAYSIGLFLIAIKYHPNEQLTIITLRQVIINIGYDFPSPWIVLLQIIDKVTNGTAKEKILK